MSQGRQRVTCNECSWALELDEMEDIRKWHHEMCPNCGKCEIVNDEDITMLDEFMQMLEVAENMSAEEMGKTVGVRMNTAPLRDSKPLRLEIIQVEE